MKRIIPFALILGALAMAVALHLAKPKPTRAEITLASVAVQTQNLQSETVFLQVNSQGNVTPRTRTSLVSEVSGTVLEVSEKFVVGGKFSRGDILLEIDPTDYKVALQRSEALLKGAEAQLIFEKARSAQAKKEWEFTGRPLEEAPSLSLRIPFLAEAEANLAQAKAEVERAKVKLNKTIIKAPYDGIVYRKNADIGQYVTIGIPLAETFAIDFVEVRLPLSEQDLSMMNDADFTDNLYGKDVILRGQVNGRDASWTASAERFERVIDEVNRSQYLVARVDDPYGSQASDNSGNPLYVGTFVTAEFKGRQLNNVFKLPRSGLIKGNRVGTVDANDLLRLLDVEIIHADDEYYYVTGLTGELAVVVSSLGTPVDGLKVQIKNNTYEEKKRGQ